LGAPGKSLGTPLLRPLLLLPAETTSSRGLKSVMTATLRPATAVTPLASSSAVEMASYRLGSAVMMES
jgi:hypothetical protein